MATEDQGAVAKLRAGQSDEHEALEYVLYLTNAKGTPTASPTT
ncbi:hypothetical protein ACKXF4_10200 [Faecalibacterium prausnitzii]